MLTGKQLRFNKKIQATCGVALTADEFHVPRDGSLYDAVEKIKPGGTIRIAAGEYRIDRVIQINKPLSIIGEGKEQTTLISDLGEHYLKVQHDGYFAMLEMCLESSEHYQRQIIAIKCNKILIKDSVFAGPRCEGYGCFLTSKSLLQHSAIYVYGNAFGEINNCTFIENIVPISLAGSSQITLTSNYIADNFTGIVFAENSTGTALHNLCEHNSNYGILFTDSSKSKAESNKCINNSQSGIRFKDSSSGIADANVCEGNSYGITVSDDASPTIIRNTCGGTEANSTIDGICFYGNSTGLVGNNVCSASSFGIRICHEAAPFLKNNICERNDCGIKYEDISSGKAEANVCSFNRHDGIRVDRCATPSLLLNECISNGGNGINCLKNKKECSGRHFYNGEDRNDFITSNYICGLGCDICEQHSDVCNAEFNSCIENKGYGILVGDNRTAMLNKNTCNYNILSGICYESRATGLAKENICVGNKKGGFVLAKMLPRTLCVTAVNEVRQ